MKKPLSYVQEERRKDFTRRTESRQTENLMSDYNRKFNKQQKEKRNSYLDRPTRRERAIYIKINRYTNARLDGQLDSHVKQSD